MNTAEFLDMSTAVLPDRVALIEGERPRTYLETSDEVVRLANALGGLGLAKGDAVGVIAVNSAQHVIIYYACAKLGLTFVPLNYRANGDELAYMMDTAGITALFVSDRYQDLIGKISPRLPSLQHAVSLQNRVDGQLHYDDLLLQGSDNSIIAEVEDDDPSVIIFTSGTTAAPKGVVVTYQDLTVYVTNTVSPADPTSDHDTILISVPLFHIAGVTAMVSAVWGGRTLVLLPQFSPEAWMEAVDQHGVTHSMVVPTMLRRIMDHPDFHRFSGRTLKLVAYGAAPMPYDTVRRAIDAFDCDLINAYGQTESTSSISFLGPDDHRLVGTPEEIAKKDNRLRSVGKIMDDVDLSVQDDEGTHLGAGRAGEICVRSGRVMKGYYKQDQATRDVLKDGWLHTGDLGYLDEDGYLFITGRTKDLIIRGGENIAPGEVEQALEDHPSVEEAAVIGVPDADWGEVVKAVIVPARGMTVTLDTVRDYCKSRLGSYKTPQYLTVVGELPRNHMGKVLKDDLRKLHGRSDNR